MLTYKVKDAAISTVSRAAGGFCRIPWRLGRRVPDTSMLFLWELDCVWPEGSVPAFLKGAGSMFQPSGAALWGVCVQPCGETRGSCLVKGGLVWEGSRSLVLLRFQIYRFGEEVKQSLGQWEREYAASAEQGNCS